MCMVAMTGIWVTTRAGKIYSVRSTHNDITSIDASMTEDFAVRQNLYTYKLIVNPSTLWRVVISEMLKSAPWISWLIRPSPDRSDRRNYGNRGELLLEHHWTGTPLKMDYARRTLENLEKLWGRPVHLKTQIENKVKILGYNGSRHEERNES